MKIDIKPLSVNKCWKGRRFKTQDYKNYETELIIKLKPLELPEPPFEVFIEFGFSNMASDTDNPVKPFVDILQKKYGFNDNKIHKYILLKKKVKKGEEYIKFSIKSFVDSK
jgi:Holliday junction resolvase RusA-like endonuclease